MTETELVEETEWERRAREEEQTDKQDWEMSNAQVERMMNERVTFCTDRVQIIDELRCNFTFLFFFLVCLLFACLMIGYLWLG